MLRIEGLTEEELDLKVKSQNKTSIIETTSVISGNKEVTMGRYYSEKTDSYLCVKRI